MSYRTILVHLNDSRRAARLLRHATEIARTCEARLLCLHVSPTFHGRVVDPAYPHTPAVEGLLFSADEEADYLRAVFEAATSQERFADFRVIRAERCDPGDVVVARARAADLVVASQSDRTWGLSALLDRSERLAIESGRPVLVVPNAGELVPLPRSALIAWNQTREATRALYEALPLLKLAGRVEVLTIDESGGAAVLDSHCDRRVVPLSAMAEVLVAHGVHTTIATLASSPVSIGHQICARAAEQNADLVVMGAYGHSRLREFVFGGATRHVLANMTVPTLFSH